MPAPGYVFRDSGTTPPPPEDDEEREFREWKKTRSRASTVNRSTVAQPPSRPSTSKGNRTFSLLSHRPSTSTSTSHHMSLPLPVPAPVPRAQQHELRATPDAGSRSSSISTRASRDYRRISDNLSGRGLVNGKDSHSGAHVTRADEGDGDDFTPERLRASIERLYNTVVVGLIAFGKDLSRLRSWRDPVHTGAFAAVYALAWLFNVVMPTLLLGLIVLIAMPEARKTLFPPAAAGAIDEHIGTASSPAEASKRMSGTTAASITANSTTKASLDKTRKEPTEPPIRTHLLRPAMHVLDHITDTWERVANTLSPTPPFNHNKRIELAAILIPVFLLSLAITLQQIARATTLLFGLAFFSKPIIQRAIDLLDAHVPDWRTYLDLRSTLLRGVPNNAERAIVLRASGANGAPISPVRGSVETARSTAATAPAKPASTTNTAITVSESNPEGTLAVTGPATAPIPVPPPPPPPPPSGAEETDYPPSSFRGSHANPHRRSRSLSRSRLGRKITSVLRRSKGHEHDHDGDNNNNNNDSGHDHDQIRAVSDSQQVGRNSHDSRFSAATTTIATTATATAAAAAAAAANEGTVVVERGGRNRLRKIDLNQPAPDRDSGR